MQKQYVVSSNLQSVGYEQSLLEIEFKSGSIYQYYHVPSIVYHNLLTAPSLGNFFHYHIKGKYHYKKIA